MGAQVVALVLDNSVLVGWFVASQATPYTGRVAKRAQREAVMVPALWAVEFTNVMLVLQRRRRLPRHAIAAILTKSARLPLATRDVSLARAARAAGVLLS